MQLVLITPPSHVATDVAQELRHVNSMFDAGLRVLHLRKPSAERADIEGYLRGISPQHRAKVVLHQHHSLAAEWKLKGIHFKERDRPPPPLQRVIPGLSQSTSLHTTQDLLQDWQQLDYAFLSPIFDSISKQGYLAAGWDEQEVREALQRAQMPVYALGGVSVDKVPDVKRMGFQGIGLIGAVWMAADPLSALRAFQEALDDSC